MDNNDHRCPRCGSQMIHKGTERETAIYHCQSCGYNEYVKVTDDNTADYLHKRSMLLGRVSKGIIDWEITQWDVLRGEILDFVAAFHAARNDIGLKMAVIACLTKGFHDLDSKKYKECKQIFKVTERVYKQYSKNPSVMPVEMADTDAMEYEEYRRMYKACRYEFLGTKTAFKLIFRIGGKFIPIPKI